ncbi:THO complex subunit 4A isoform X1 [Malania oleifera]|uniref:THO complex subunit 4A isoform X1 n=1 Tax=Malania oleifera TaxID=397392 RepID=UPI0025AE3E1D|nr:THO complex subunit 4A isoform X1 [Malania oleifera]
MSSALDMSLDDLIKTNKKAGGGSSRGRGRASGPGPARRFPNRGANRAAPYAPPKAPDSTWQHDMFADQALAYPAQAVRASAIETGTKLYISNLDYGVSNEDIKVIFFYFYALCCLINIPLITTSSEEGTEVVFSRRADAVAAVKRYNNVQLDGKPMKIEIVGTNIVTPAPVPSAMSNTFGNTNGVARSGQGRGVAQGRLRGGGGRGFGRGRGRGRGRGEKVSAEDLDADLENYHKEAMEIN